MIRKTITLPGGFKVTLSPSGVTVSAKVGNSRITKHASGRKSVSMNLGGGLRYTKRVK